MLIVDDGSYDGTSAYVQAAWANHPCLRIVTLDKNQGKGAAVRRGVFECAASSCSSPTPMARRRSPRCLRSSLTPRPPPRS